MHQSRFFGGWEASEPANDLLAIGMAGECVYPLYGRSHRNIATIDS